MSNETRNSIHHRLAIAATSILLGLGAAASVQAASPFATESGAEAPFVLAAATQGAENRQDRRDGRQDNRGDRRDDRQDCRSAEGAGKDKRDCKQDARSDRRDKD